MNAFAELSLVFAYVAIVMGTLVILRNNRDPVHRLFFLFCAGAFYWCFVEYGMRHASGMAEAQVWSRAFSFWPLPEVFLLHFVLLYSGIVKPGRRPVSLSLLYAPALAFSLLDLFTMRISGAPVLEPWGWTYGMPHTWEKTASVVWACSVTAAAVVVCIRFVYKTAIPRVRKQGIFILCGVLAPVVSGYSTDAASFVLGLRIPEMSSLGFALGTVFIGYAIFKYNLFNLAPAAASQEIIDTVPDILLLIDNGGTIVSANRATTALLGYGAVELAGKPLEFIVADRDRDSVRSLVEGRKSRPGDACIEINLRKKQGGSLPFNVTTGTVRDSQLVYQGTIFVAHDVSGYKRIQENLSLAKLEAERTKEIRQTNDAMLNVMEDLRAEISLRESNANALRETNEYLENLFNYANAPIIVWDPQFNITRFNRAFESLTGRKSGEVVGQSLEILFPAADLEPSMKRIRSTFAGERWEAVEIPIVTVDGSVKTVLWNSATVFSDDGKTPVATIAQGQDITERKRAEEALKESEEKFRQIFESANVGKSMTLPSGEIQVNQAFCDLLGYTKEELQHKKWQELTPSDEVAFIQHRMEVLLGGMENASRFEKSYLHKNGKRIWADVSTVIQRDAQGKPLFFITTIVDITGRKLVENKLRISEEKFSNAFHISPAGMTITRIADGTFIDANESFLRIFGFSREEVVGHTSTELNMWTAEERKKLIQRQVEAGGLQNHELVARSKSGKNIILFFSSKQLDLQGEPCHVTTMIDVTERRQAEEALRTSDEKQNAMISNISDVIGVIGLDGVIKYKSPNIEKWFGWKPQDLIGTDGWLTVHPDDIERIQKEFHTLLEKDKASKTVEYRYKCKNGNYRWIELTATNFKHDPAISGVLLNYHDITGRKQSENALIESEQKYRSLFNSMLEGFALHEIICDENGKPVDYRFLDMNPAFERLTGLKKSDAIGRTVLSILPTTESIWIEKYGAVALTGVPIDFENYASTFARHYHVVAFCPKKNQFAVIFSDITERKRADEALVESERKLREAQKMAQLGHWNWDVKTGDVEWSEEVFKIFRLDPQSFKPQIDSILAFSPWPEDHERDKELIRKAMESREVGNYEQRFLRPDQSVGYYSSTFQGKYDDSGNLVTIIGTVVDITERKLAEEAIRESEEKFRTIFENSASALAIIEKDTTISMVNREYCKLSGYEAHEVMGMSWTKQIPPEDLGRLQEYNRRRLTDPDSAPGHYEFTFYRKDGEVRNGLISVAVLPTSHKIITSFVDITDRKKSEQALREGEEKFSIAFKSSPYALIITSVPDGNIVEANDSVSQITGYPREELIGSSTPVLNLWVSPDDRAEVLRELSAGRSVFGREYLFKKKNHEIITGMYSAGLIRLGGKPHVLSSILDITARKKLENDLQQYTVELEQKKRDLEQIIYVTSHDLRTPLVNIQGFGKELGRSTTDLMAAIQAGDLSPAAMRRVGPILRKDIPESIEFIQSGITRMDLLLKALLKFSRLGRASIRVERLDMNALVHETVKSIEFTAKEKNAQIRVSELPPCMGDLAQTTQIFLNIIENALKYLDPKRTGVILIHGERRNSEAVYCIEDNGIGIAPEYQKKIFEIFYRINQDAVQGDGLGLAVARQSAEKQNGRIWVESEPGKGCRFFIKLPGTDI